MDTKTIEIAKRVLKIEAEAISALMDKVGNEFTKAVDLIYYTSGKVVVTGMGKSGIICKKMAATFVSTGTPAFFLHPAEGIHGDIGMIMKNDTVIAISNSGETEEIIRLLPLIKRMGVKLIAITGNPGSTLARSGDVVLDIGVREEACPMGLVPTASTTATLAMGDALAVALLDRRGFREDDFALLHPGGTLGRRLLTRVEDLMHTGESIPLVKVDTLMKDAILEMTTKGLGVTGVVNERGEVVGVITDGDLRRALERGNDILGKEVLEVMTRDPKGIERKALAESALKKMEDHAITSLFVYERDGDKRPLGIIHLHDLLRAGIV
ncbi:MAG: KpsF/GutQ family sugar-phosphate isomerase [Deltaproteobacteria bacterium]|nr:KpsF/GutQ family sugar-phosphate isomerase [Deltaproteobacteria bacterium]